MVREKTEMINTDCERMKSSANTPNPKILQRHRGKKGCEWKAHDQWDINIQSDKLKKHEIVLIYFLLLTIYFLRVSTADVASPLPVPLDCHDIHSL